MTLEDARKVAAIISEADDRCRICVCALMRECEIAWPQFEWSYDEKNYVIVVSER